MKEPARCKAPPPTPINSGEFPAQRWIWMQIYITPGTNLAQDVYEIFLKWSLFTNQVIHLCGILKTVRRLVDSYYYYLSLVKHQVLRAVQATHVSSQPLLPGRYSRAAWSKAWASFFPSPSGHSWWQDARGNHGGNKGFRDFFVSSSGFVYASCVFSECPLHQSSFQGILLMK